MPRIGRPLQQKAICIRHTCLFHSWSGFISRAVRSQGSVQDRQRSIAPQPRFTPLISCTGHRVRCYWKEISGRCAAQTTLAPFLSPPQKKPSLECVTFVSQMLTASLSSAFFSQSLPAKRNALAKIGRMGDGYYLLIH